MLVGIGIEGVASSVVGEGSWRSSHGLWHGEEGRTHLLVQVAKNVMIGGQGGDPCNTGH